MSAKCNLDHIVKNGIRQNGKQTFKCLICGIQFVEKPSEHYPIPRDTIEWVDRLLLERIPLAGIARVAQVAERWLQYYVNDTYETVSRELTVQPKKKGQLTVECDERQAVICW